MKEWQRKNEFIQQSFEETQRGFGATEITIVRLHKRLDFTILNTGLHIPKVTLSYVTLTIS